VVLVVREITFANDFDGLHLGWQPNGTDARVRYGPMGVRIS